jgi:hypothetical protein
MVELKRSSPDWVRSRDSLSVARVYPQAGRGSWRLWDALPIPQVGEMSAAAPPSTGQWSASGGRGD